MPIKMHLRSFTSCFVVFSTVYEVQFLRLSVDELDSTNTYVHYRCSDWHYIALI